MSERAPRACGALGRFDRDRLTRVAAAFDCELSPVHEDERSALLLDREPIRWGGREERGLGWIEGDVWRGGSNGASDWKQAATLGACGLVIAGKVRFVHSSISGLAPVYWMSDGPALYFASRIDPLVQAATRPLSVDWDAWASIIVLRYPLGERTPFAEVRRLGPFARLGRRLGRARVETPSWPWAEVEAGDDPGPGIAATAEALREVMAPLGGDLICPLSGGLDSRLLLSTAAQRGPRSLLAVTASDDEGERYEERLAAPVAARLGVELEQVSGREADYPADWDERSRRVEHQFVDHAWLMPFAHRVDRSGAAVLDGYGIDTFLQAAARFATPELLGGRDPGARSGALFEAMRGYGHSHQALDPGLGERTLNRAREQFLAAAEPFAAHPAQPIVAFYATRTVRGISTYPSGVLGRQAEVIVPGANDAFIRAALSIPIRFKLDPAMRLAVQERVSAAVARLPSSHDTPRGEVELPRRWRSERALEMHRQLLADGPLTPFVERALLDWLDDPGRGELPPGLRLGMEAISLFHHWYRLYRNRLRDPDAADLPG